MPETIGSLIQRRLSELGMSKAELAKRIGVSRAYIGDLANQTAKTQSGYYRPSPEIIDKLAKSLKIEPTDLLKAVGYAFENGKPHKPQNAAEFVQRLAEMGFDIQMSADFAALGPDDLQEMIEQIEANFLIKARRRKRP